ncbi:uncharacterized protein LOC142329347 [Lycorma delicatula]|uniref:uncharacterized protein LOC142329347 n=1 Tax=Lycorma delicatula TaxID=130591 RepID=UPI003F50FCA6
MGKKGRKTRWRRLPIGGPESTASSPVEEQEAVVTPSPEHRVTFNEDEYTKITTPRQDVLFKKGYLGRRRTNNTTDAQEIHSADSVESEYVPEEQPQFTYVSPTGYIDHTGVFYVNSGTYELYDPYSGNVTVVVGPAPQYPPQPVLAAMPCQPVPLTPLEWFNPPTPWVCPYNNRRKRYSTDSQNCSAQSSESTGPPGSPQEPLDEGAGAMFPPQPPPYVYPGYMFGAPVYNMNGVNVQGVVPQTPVPVTADFTMTKRRKKRRRRRRGGVTDEGSESSCEEVIGCDAGVCSQSGASSDAGQGSSCSKTNSDSGINTEPTPDSGSNTPPLMPPVDLSSAQNFEKSEPVEDCIQPPSDLENEAELEPISSSVSTPEALKHTLESLPSEDGETLQELSCSSELNESKLTSCSSELISCNSEHSNAKPIPCSTLESNENDIKCELKQSKTELDSCDSKTSENPVDLCISEQIEPESISCCSQFSDSLSVVNDVPSNEENDENHESVDEKTSSFNEISSDINYTNGDLENESVELEEVEDQKENENENEGNKEIKEEIVEIVEEAKEREIKFDLQGIENEDKELEVIDNELLFNEDSLKGAIENEELNSNKALLDEISEDINEEIKLPEVTMPITNTLSHNLNQFSSCHEVHVPIPPPRRRRSLYRAAEKVAKKVVDEVINEGIKEATCVKCQHSLPITEAVTRWLQSQGPAVLSPADSDDDKDEGIEEGEGSTNQKNVEGNPFLAPYLSGSRKRVADSDDCGSLVSSAGEWDMYDHESHTRAICDPATSVDKYYRLGTEDLDDKMASSPSVIKTAVHIRRAGPFPCGVCCIIQ